MPIKFRCDACGQLLGIARRKSGTLVNCPRCKKTLKVPTEEQAAGPPASPPPAPLLERHDFDKWIGKGVASSKPSPASVSAVAPPPPVSAPPAIASYGETDAIAESDSAEWAEPSPKERFPSPMILAAGAVAVVLVSFGLGLAVGRYAVPASSSSSVGEKAAAKVAAAVADAAKAAPVVEDDDWVDDDAEAKKAVADKIAVTGSIKYTADGKEAPDEGACVIVFPTNQQLTEKIVALGLRPLDRNLQNRPGMEQLRRYGGEFAYVDANGAFNVPLEREDTYYVLVLSKNVARDPAQEIYLDEQSILRQYFSDIDGLLGDRAFLLATRDASKSIPLKHAFGH